MAEDRIDAVLGEAEARGLTHANFGVFEVNGSFRSKRYNIRHLKKAMTEGIPWLAIPSGLDPTDGIIGGNSWANPELGFQDGLVLMDACSARAMPLDSGGQGMVLVGSFTGDVGRDCVRALLEAELERLGGLGFDLYGGFELEGTVLRETAESAREKRSAELDLMPGYDRVYSFVNQTGQAAFIDELLDCSTAMGLPIDTIHAEFTNILEVGLEPATGVRIADNAGLYKAMAKLVAARHGGYLSFMARRSEHDQGCGAHINVSLKSRKTGESVFADPDGAYGLSEIGRQFLAGLVKYLPELFLLLAPNLNSYKRYAPGLFTPLNNSWAINNKTVALRLVNATAASTRIEVRPAGADVCPHLGLLAVCLAGRLGIEEALEPPAPNEGNVWAAEDTGAPPLPLEMGAAMEAFAASRVAKETLGERFHGNFLGDRRHQLDAFSQVVTDWEVAMFSNL